MKEDSCSLGDIRAAMEPMLADAPSRIVLSEPRKKDAEVRKAVLVMRAGAWQMERHTATQVLHKNIPAAQLADELAAALSGEFAQLAVFGASYQHSLRITKKGRVLAGRHTAGDTGVPAAPAATHDRQKNHILARGGDIPVLRDIGVLTAEGRVAAPMQDKYRQINRFVELVDDALRGETPKKLRVVDFGCGKSYLTFVLYHYLTQIRGIDARVTGLDLKADVVKKCSAAAQRYGYSGLEFAVGDIADYAPEGGVDMVVALHACDTATDLALAHAVRWGARFIFCAPCCQHQLAGQMHSEELALLVKYGIVKERVAALCTDALRAALLTACGYKTQLVEFVELEHTPKNILIRAQRAGQPLAVRQKALAEAQRLEAAFGFEPELHHLLQELLPET